MFELISQLENAAYAYVDHELNLGNPLAIKEDTVEWKAALLLRNYHDAINMVIDNTKFKDDGVMITYRHYALFLEVINRLTYGQ